MKFLAILVPLALVSPSLTATVYLTVFERNVPWTGRKSEFAGEKFWEHLRTVKTEMRQAFDRMELPTSKFTLKLMTRPDSLNANFAANETFRCDVRCRLLVLSNEPLTSKASSEVITQAFIVNSRGTRGPVVDIPLRFALTKSIWRATDRGASVIRIAPALRAALSEPMRRDVRLQENARSVRLELALGTAHEDFVVELGAWSVAGFRKYFFLQRGGLNLFYWMNRCRNALE